MNIYLDMVGCRLNQSELENYARQFRMAGHNLVPDPEQADMIVINTCTVTAAAASDSRQKIRQAARSGAGRVMVTGCWSDLNPAEAAAIPGVKRVIHNREKDQLVPDVLSLPASYFVDKSASREAIPGNRLRTRAFIKAQDGCDNACTYCITTIARGEGRSRSVAEVVADVHSAADGEAQEAVLTGVHLGSWGYDLDPPSHLSKLIEAILAETDIPRLHLSSLEPWDITPAFFGLWENRRLCRHLHLPLQSGSQATLRRMGRRITPAAYARLVDQARTSIPGVAITTDLMVGFPGETEAEFAESASFVEDVGFTHGHIFTYSARPGTAAARLPDQIPHQVASQRYAILHEILQKSAATFLKEQVGKEMMVLWEKASPTSTGQWLLRGLTDNYLLTRALAPTPCHNQIMSVRIHGIEQGELTGEITQAQSWLQETRDTI